MNIQNTVTQAQKDSEAFSQVDNGRLNDLLAYAAKKSGRSVVKLGMEFSRLSRGRGKLQIADYIRYGLFYEDRFTDEERSQFISNSLHWPIAHKCNDNGWSSAAEEKSLQAQS